MQRKVAIIFTSTALLWIMRPYLGALSAHIHWSDTDPLLAALLLFSLTGEWQNLLDWESTSTTLLAFYSLEGGLALAGTLQQSYWFEALEVE